MTTFKIGFLSAVVTLTPFFAFAGAVSAGGLLSPVSLECLFIDLESPLEPFNFTIADFATNEKAARLEQFDLQLVETVWAISYDQFSATSKHGLRFYSAGNGDTKAAIEINNFKPISDNDVKSLYAPLLKVKGTDLVEGVRKYVSELKFRGRSYHGVCADEFFIFYGSR